MNKMIERVATNFWLHMSFEQDPALFKRQDKFIIKHYVEAARLAIEGMREPTDNIINELPMPRNGHYNMAEQRQMKLPYWQKAIDAALQE